MTKNEAKTVKKDQIIYLKTHLLEVEPLNVSDVQILHYPNDAEPIYHFEFTDNTYENVAKDNVDYLFLTEKEALLACKAELKKKTSIINKRIKELDKSKEN